MWVVSPPGEEGGWAGKWMPDAGSGNTSFGERVRVCLARGGGWVRGVSEEGADKLRKAGRRGQFFFSEWARSPSCHLVT
jgi:hypothetical protein